MVIDMMIDMMIEIMMMIAIMIIMSVMILVMQKMMKFMRWCFNIVDRSPIEGRGKSVVRRVNDLDNNQDEEDVRNVFVFLC